MALKVFIAFSLLFCVLAIKDEAPHERNIEEFGIKWFEKRIFQNETNSINSLAQMEIYFPLISWGYLILVVISLLTIWCLLTLEMYPIVVETPNVIHTSPCDFNILAIYGVMEDDSEVSEDDDDRDLQFYI